MPILVLVATKEAYANPDFQRWLGASAPRGGVIEYDGEHVDLYGDMFEHVVADETAFLDRVLPAAGRPPSA